VKYSQSTSSGTIGAIVRPSVLRRSAADPVKAGAEESVEILRMSSGDLFLIGDVQGFTPQIGRLVSMMNYTRYTTLAEVEGLSVDQLDYLHDEQSNSIGALLFHIAAVEVWYQAATFDGRDLNDEEMREWGSGLDLGERARREIRGHDLEYYRRRLERARATTLAELGRREDPWLDEKAPFWGGRPANNYFKWFHVVEDELSHRGQIRWLRKRATA
jgi:hypothetical protein